MTNLKYFIQDANGNLLRDIEAVLKGQNDGFTNDNTSSEQVLDYDTKVEAQLIIDKHEWTRCKVVQLPYSIFDEKDNEIAQFVEFADALSFHRSKPETRLILGSWVY